MRTELSDRYKILFIIFISLGVYYPSIFGQVNTVDDHMMITNLLNTYHVDWKGIFFPGNPIYYYRPLLALTFLFDRFVFDCSASFMHLNNMLIHTANGVLIFFIVKELLRIFRIADFLSLSFILSVLSVTLFVAGGFS